MGVKYFFSTMKRRYRNCFDQRLRELSHHIAQKGIDIFCIDMNGIYHLAAQKVFKYGNYAPRKTFINKNVHKPVLVNEETLNALHKQICNEVEFLIRYVCPRKVLVLCTDGVAGYAKSFQQRQRRFGAMNGKDDADTEKWSSNNLSIGTKYMHDLTAYVENHIIYQKNNDNIWKQFDVVWSNEKVEGEGEHNILNYIRKFADKSDKICIHAMDADLIMLSMALHRSNTFILRDDHMSDKITYVIDISALTRIVRSVMDPQHRWSANHTIDDFVFLCFILGNDFLPNIPSVETMLNGVDLILDNYQFIDEPIVDIKKKPLFNIKSLQYFFELMQQNEKPSLVAKLNGQKTFFKDDIIDRNKIITENGINIKYDDYVADYYRTKVGNDEDVMQLCQDYFEGLEWVFKYYSSGMPNWKWMFNSLYAPFFKELVAYLPYYNSKGYGRTVPVDPVHQLLMIIPPQSSHLLPPPFNTLIKDENFTLKDQFPRQVSIDLSGKYQEWEGIIKLPKFDVDGIEKFYNEHKKGMDCKYNNTSSTKLFKNGGKQFIINLNN